MIDRGYLDSIGWRGVRVRREHLLRALPRQRSELRAAGEKLRIADVAAGHGRYVLDAVAQLPERPQSIVLRDLSELNVARAAP
jgi:hypothetical protein